MSPHSIIRLEFQDNSIITSCHFPNSVLTRSDPAPDFIWCRELKRDQYVLSQATSSGTNVLLLFFPFDFSPVCTQELCEMRNAAWFEAVDDVEVWGVSSDSTAAHRTFADQYNLNYPLSSEQRAEVAERDGVKCDWWDGHMDVPQRAVFVGSPEMQLEYDWTTDDASHNPDLWVIKEAIDAIRDDVETAAEVALPAAQPGGITDTHEAPFGDHDE